MSELCGTLLSCIGRQNVLRFGKITVQGVEVRYRDVMCFVMPVPALPWLRRSLKDLSPRTHSLQLRDPYEIYGRKSGIKIDSSPTTSVFPVRVILQIIHTHSTITNRPNLVVATISVVNETLVPHCKLALGTSQVCAEEIFISYHVMSSHIIPNHIVIYRIISYRIVSYSIILYYVMLCYIKLRYDTLCYAVLY